MNLKLLIDEERNDVNIVCASLGVKGNRIKYVNDRLKANRNVILSALTSCKNQQQLQIAPDNLKDE